MFWQICWKIPNLYHFSLLNVIKTRSWFQCSQASSVRQTWEVLSSISMCQKGCSMFSFEFRPALFQSLNSYAQGQNVIEILSFHLESNGMKTISFNASVDQEYSSITCNQLEGPGRLYSAICINTLYVRLHQISSNALWLLLNQRKFVIHVCSIIVKYPENVYSYRIEITLRKEEPVSKGTKVRM